MYLWIKAFHLMSIVTWFAAMFYLPACTCTTPRPETRVSTRPWTPSWSWSASCIAAS